MELKDFQVLRMRAIIDYVLGESPFYRDLFTKNGINSKVIDRIDDLSALPFTTPEDLRNQPYRLLCLSLSNVKRVYTLPTGGTSGPPKMVFFSEDDLNRIVEYMGVAMKSVAESAGVSRHDFAVYQLLPDGKPESQQQLLARGVRSVGGTPYLGDLSLTTDEQLHRIQQYKPDLLFGPASRIYRMTQEGRDSHDLATFGLKVLFTTSGYVPSSMRERLQTIWNAEVFTHYGMTEMGWAGGIECAAHNGFHFNEADLLLEIVDPLTGMPLAKGEEGELVMTTLRREAMPLIRYRTGDLGKIESMDCGCGTLALHRLCMLRRKDAVVRIATGDELDPHIFDDVLYRIPGIISYQSALVVEGSKERLVLTAELVRRWPRAEEDIVDAILAIPTVQKGIKADLMDIPRVNFVDKGMLKPTGRAKPVIQDLRTAA